MSATLTTRPLAKEPQDLDSLPLGATYLGDGRTAFNVWSPKADRAELLITSQNDRRVTLQPVADGYRQAIVDGVQPGDRYFFALPGDRRLPDPASRHQPDGVHKASAVVDASYAWSCRHWHGLPWTDYIVYELHVGTFSPQGTFDGVIEQLDALVELGITAIEIMPVSQCPGGRNWGYDGVHPFAPQNTYGGPMGLKRLVDAAHQRGLAVVLDVVYNHLGPEGNYLGEFGPYFTEKYHTPWGAALNFDGADSDHVRRYFIDNALEWITDYRMDALRLDAIHAIFDQSARPFLQQLADDMHQRARQLGRQVYLIAESNLNDPRHVTRIEHGGYGLDAQWNDDLEHCLRVLLTGQADGYYCDYTGLEKLAKAYRDGFVGDGAFSEFRRCRFGAPSTKLASEQLVVFSQNHDQVGNRPCGERLSQLVDFESLKLAAAAVILSPNVPMLFMGEEYGETAPFLYFVSHTQPDLLDAVRRGRRAEFAGFAWPDDWPDPCVEETFERSRLNHSLRCAGRHRELYGFYRELIRLRKTVPALKCLRKEQLAVTVVGDGDVIALRRWDGDSQAVVLMNFADKSVSATMQLPSGEWKLAVDSADQCWLGPGSDSAVQLRSTGSAEVIRPPRSAAMWLRT